MKLCKLAGGLSLFICASVSALTLLPVPTEPFYYEPPVKQATEEQQAFSCAQLDMVINELHPYRYSYKPGFYQDNLNQTAVALIMVDAIPLNGMLALSYLGYSTLVEAKENRRMLMVEQYIAALQHVKASKHCYE